MPIVIAGLILAFLVLLLFGGSELDQALLYLLAAPDTPRLDQAAWAMDWLAVPLPLLLAAVAGAAWLAMKRNWRDALLLLALILCGRLLVEAIQGLTLDLRPPAPDHLFPGQERAYPSGPAANATITGFALAFLLSHRAPARGWALAAAATFALAVGTAQLLLGAAWPTAVIGGWGLGLAWTLLLLQLARADLGDGAVRTLRREEEEAPDPPPLAEHGPLG